MSDSPCLRDALRLPWKFRLNPGGYPPSLKPASTGYEHLLSVGKKRCRSKEDDIDESGSELQRIHNSTGAQAVD
jgi:hypothetical protein